MDEPEFNSELFSRVDEVLAKLPTRCQGCKFAEFLITTSLAFSDSIGGAGTILSLTDRINDECSGYTGTPADTLELEAISIVEDPFDPMESFAEPTPEGVTPNALLFIPDSESADTLDRENCPYYLSKQ